MLVKPAYEESKKMNTEKTKLKLKISLLSVWIDVSFIIKFKRKLQLLPARSTKEPVFT